VADAHERLRQYLEQRREAGEREFVLDDLSVEEALRLIGARADTGTAATRGASGAAPARREPGAAPSAAPPIAPRTVSASRDEAAGEDWRAAFRAAGITPRAGDGPRHAAPGELPPAGAPEQPAAVPRAASDAARGPDSAPTSAEEAATADPAPDQAGDRQVSVEEADGRIVVGPGRLPPIGPTIAAAASLAEVEALIRGCTACGLCQGALNAVPGEGDPHAEFVVVGEAPGATEDETGRPFVGRSGELLTKILEAIGLPRQQVFICNVIKHRPPANRNPTAEEVAACRPFLLRQLELLRPKVILGVGTFAAQTLLGTKTPIGKLRGIEHSYYGVPLVVTYHPAALLRNPAWKRPTWEDVQFARRLLDRARGDA
jgi:uracil-DNA glycosylase